MQFLKKGGWCDAVRVSSYDPAGAWGAPWVRVVRRGTRFFLGPRVRRGTAFPSRSGGVRVVLPYSGVAGGLCAAPPFSMRVVFPFSGVAGGLCAAPPFSPMITLLRVQVRRAVAPVRAWRSGEATARRARCAFVCALVRLWWSGEATRKRSRAMSKRRPLFRRGRSPVAPRSPLRCAVVCR